MKLQNNGSHDSQQLRTLEPVNPSTPSTSHTSSDTLSSLTGGISSLVYRGPKLPVHDEVDQTFLFRGEELRVKKEMRVKSAGDPSLVAVMAKGGRVGTRSSATGTSVGDCNRG
jgi:hypothetical protein